MSTKTKHTKTGATSREIDGADLGPRWAEYKVPAGTRVIWIGRWVIDDLSWLATQYEANFAKRYPDAVKSYGKGFGARSIDHHDADHYGIQVDSTDVTSIKEA